MNGNAIDKLFDENNSDNVILYNEKNEAVEFEQIAVICMKGDTYAILKPVELTPGMADDEALVFLLEEFEGEQSLSVVMDDAVLDLVFDEYYKLLEENGVDTD